jgi:hypothetical protein
MTTTRNACRLLFLLLLRPYRVVSQGTSLAGGIVTRTNVDQWAAISTDARDMAEQLTTNGATAGLEIYQQGRNAEKSPGVKLTLQSLSTELASLGLAGTPNFLFHLYGLADRSTEESDLLEQAHYADNFVREAIATRQETAVQGVLVLSLWMYGTHLLWKGIDTCQKRTLADNPGQLQLGGGGMDEFIALWIGQFQEAGTSDGNSLYAVTQIAGDLFGKTSPEAAANSQILGLYQEGAAALSFPGACTAQNDQVVPQLWGVTQQIISQMNIPLMQLLIDALFRQDGSDVTLYSTAIVPQISQCRPSVYKRLKDELLTSSVVFSKTQSIIADLQSIYDCLGFTCSDIGAYGDELGQCDDFQRKHRSIVGYNPVTRVHDHGKIDLDILQIQILASLGSFSFAKYLYNYGRNSPKARDSENDPYELRSLKKFATADERQSAAPYYAEFASYHNDPIYADIAIVQTLDGLGKWGGASRQIRAQVVSITCAYQVMYMYALAEMADALTDCEIQDSYNNEGGEHSWDEVAAFMIGSLEGSEEGGSPDSEDGQLLWNLANKRAFQFQTMNDLGYAYANSDLEDLLFAGKAQLDAYDCVNLEKTTARIQNLLLIPIIQSTLRYAIINEQLSAASGRPEIAIGDTFALSVLPVVAYHDRDAAEIVEENMLFRAGVKPVREGSQEVADAFYATLDNLGVRCHDIGATPQADVCRLEGGFKPREGGSGALRRGSISSLLLGGALLLVMNAVL